MTDRSTGSKPRELSYSQLSTWLACRRRWTYSYGLRAKSKVSTDALDIGSLVHDALQAFFTGRQASEVFHEWFSTFETNQPLRGLDLTSKRDELLASAKLIYGAVLADVRKRGFVVLANAEGKPYVEYPLSAPLDGWDRAIGYTDIILYDPAQEVAWLTDWKTRGYFAGQDSTDYDLQGIMYQYMARLEGIPVAGVITYQVSSKPPSIPTVNKNGTMSRARIACDWDTYRLACIAAGLDPKDYEAEMRPKLTDYEPVRPLFALRSDETLQNVWDTVVVPAAKQIAIVRDAIESGSHETLSFALGQCVRNLSNRECSRCNYSAPCIAGLKGYDELGILAERYDYDPAKRIRLYGS